MYFTKRGLMKMETHLKRLLDKHLSLDKEIQHAKHFSSTDDFRLHEMKKQKLRLKEEIERLKLFSDDCNGSNYPKFNSTIKH